MSGMTVLIGGGSGATLLIDFDFYKVGIFFEGGGGELIMWKGEGL